MADRQQIAAQVLEMIADSPVVGFSGSRSPSEKSAAVVRWAARQCKVPAVVGCARGVDAVVRQCLTRAVVFSATSQRPAALARRSASCVQHIASGSGLWCFFPASSCPPGLLPSSRSSACFCGSGSGTWASAAFAAGLGVPCLCWLPSGVEPPSWGFSALGYGWWLRQVESGVQGSFLVAFTT